MIDTLGSLLMIILGSALISSVVVLVAGLAVLVWVEIMKEGRE